MTTASSQGSSSTAIQTHHTYIPSPLPTAPSFDLHLTRFRDTLLIWVGTSAPSDGSALADEQEDKRIAADWSVAMPSNRVCVSLRLEEGYGLMSRISQSQPLRYSGVHLTFH
jgi:hypothetical protein